ncbi:MAG: hypothetical protein GYA52_12145 [Chloroflexi bacterium]|nr:hypothetical protein [Chloroflexota bacterium]
MKIKIIPLFTVSILGTALILSSCSGTNASGATPTVFEPTATALPLKEAVVCVADEPESLFLYGKSNKTADLIHEAIYDGPFDRVAYEHVPVIVDKLPSLSDGSASYSPVGVNGGDLMVDVEGNVTNLVTGVQLYPRGCQSLDCAVTWDGVSQIQMDQLTLVFKIKDGIRWSDGKDVTAGDSQYSFRIAQDLHNTAYQNVIDRIVDYQVLDEHSVLVTILPGFVTSDYASYFFTPLPQHVWSSYAPADLATTDMATKLPLAWGPFQITDWQAGKSITLEKNDYYFRASEGYPAVDKINIKFIKEDRALNDLLENEGCDVVDSSLITEGMTGETTALQADPDYGVEVLTGENWEVLLFGIKPASYDDGYYPYGSDRPDILGDAAVRNAIRQCVDVTAIRQVAGMDGEQAQFTYFPYLPEGLTVGNTVSYDPTSAQSALTTLGWKDLDSNPETPRTAAGVSNVPDGTALTLNLFASQSSQNTQIAESIKNSLAQCGVQVNVFSMSPTELYAAGPEGVLFGRNFDLALIAWHVGDTLPCQLFESKEIPSIDNYWIGEDAGGGNIGGYQNAEFDRLCEIAQNGSADPTSAFANHVAAATILDQESPFVSLFFTPRVLVTKNSLCIPGEKQDENYPYSSIEYWDFSDTCN